MRWADNASTPAEATPTTPATITPLMAASVVGRNSTVSRPQVTESRMVPAKKRLRQAAWRSRRWRSRRNSRPSTMRTACTRIFSTSQAASSGAGTQGPSSSPRRMLNAMPPTSIGWPIA